MKTLHEKISIKDEADHNHDEIVLGDLTEKQYDALGKVADLSQGYHFTVIKYGGGPSSSATHVKVWKDGNDSDYVALVGKDCAQYYDQKQETLKVVKRVAHRVYRFCPYFQSDGGVR